MRALADRRMVFFAGLPGTGKSLLVHQLTHLAVEAGRTVHLLQWDVARPVFEATPAGQRYPLADGVTHAVIRKAAGLWVRVALAGWNARHRDSRHLLIGETPFVGNRFVEVARPLDDDAETVLAADSCRFALAIPSRDVRRFLEAERERRATAPLHPREREDAPPQVLRDLWRDLTEVAGRLEVGTPAVSPGSYDPVMYRRVYERLLRHRHTDVLALDVVLPTAQLSVYDFAVPAVDLAPSEADAEAAIREVEGRYAHPAALEHEIAHWWQVLKNS
jgi:hypothetical protein